MKPSLPPTPWPIPDSACADCGKQLAWREGVGRYVITHATGHDECSLDCVRVRKEDVARAKQLLEQMNGILVASRLRSTLGSRA